jgi:hypothetical protein
MFNHFVKNHEVIARNPAEEVVYPSRFVDSHVCSAGRTRWILTVKIDRDSTFTRLHVERTESLPLALLRGWFAGDSEVFPVNRTAPWTSSTSTTTERDRLLAIYRTEMFSRSAHWVATIISTAITSDTYGYESGRGGRGDRSLWVLFFFFFHIFNVYLKSYRYTWRMLINIYHRTLCISLTRFTILNNSTT